MFALIDVNSFYANCEKIFRPDLKNKPVIVLSNNDGCVIARSEEAKKIGIKMTQPFFKLHPKFLEKHQVTVFSSNYALYADMSARVMDTIESYVPKIEIYSIDECFCDVSTLNKIKPYENIAFEIKNAVQKNTHLPVGIGIARTKTLAKLANNAAKKWQKTSGIVVLNHHEREKKLMSLMPIEDIWGIGSAIVKKLNDMNIYTALDLAKMPYQIAKKHFSVNLERTVRELNGEPCLSIDDISGPRKQIVCSRSIGDQISDIKVLKSALSQYVSRAAERLRANHSLTKMISVFVKTNPFNHLKPQYSNSVSQRISATNDTTQLLKTAHSLLNKIFKENYEYSKIGVILNDFQDESLLQDDLFSSNTFNEKSEKLMSIIDSVNKKNKSKIYFASEKLSENWGMNRNYLSPAYTTRLNEIKTVFID